MRFTVYKGPTGKTLIGPTLIHLLGTVFFIFGLVGIIGAVSLAMEESGTEDMIGCIFIAIIGFVLMAALHKLAEKLAEKSVHKP